MEGKLGMGENRKQSYFWSYLSLTMQTFHVYRTFGTCTVDHGNKCNIFSVDISLHACHV
jgi:hypothetical protein